MNLRTVKVESLGQRGDGLVRDGDRMLHFAKVLPGEVITLEGDRLVAIKEKSAERVDPFCEVHDTCGGCKFQHWREENYRNWKHALVADTLAAAGLVTEVAPLIDAHGKGRRRVSLHVREIDGVWRAGFMAERSHVLQPLDQCPVLVSELSGVLEIAASFGLPLGVCDVAVTAASNGLDVAIKAERIANDKRLPVLQQLFEKYKLCRLSLNGEPLFTRATPMIVIGKSQVPLPIQSFLQATAEGERVLAELVTSALKKARNTADLFCGVGPFALRLAETRPVFASDADKQAIGGLLQAMRHTQGLKPMKTEVRDLFRNPLVEMELRAFDSVVFDPPRAGAIAQAQQLAKSKVKYVAAVSCDLSTFIRDAKILVDGGYKLKTVTPVDQFKWTPHVELVGTFVK
jgi:23S rRNA (uracil1939-C5)-methyltransferase